MKYFVGTLLSAALALAPVAHAGDSRAAERKANSEQKEAEGFTKDAQKAAEGLKAQGQTKDQKKQARKGGVISTPSTHMGKNSGVSLNSKIQKDPRSVENKENTEKKK